MIVVSDTSALTSLIHVGQLGLLRELYGSVLIPTAVHRELLRSHSPLPSFLEAREISDHKMALRLEAELDLGEAEAIVLAKETRANLLLIDEKLGRQVAELEGVPITGLMGVLVEAKRQSKLNSVRELVELLEDRAGFRVSQAVKEEAFLAAGE
ncbi:MAG: DUF3368 domain-containing protein [Verrucomicrobia bacterium]|nr:DUF3368 domain-containing protein [Verrucomicrobiota bacterium]